MKQTPPAFVLTKQCNLLHDKCAAEQSFFQRIWGRVLDVEGEIKIVFLSLKQLDALEWKHR